MVNPFLLPMRLALGHNDEGAVTFQEHGWLSSAFAVTDLAAAAVAAAGLEVAGLLGSIGERKPEGVQPKCTALRRGTLTLKACACKPSP